MEIEPALFFRSHYSQHSVGPQSSPGGSEKLNDDHSTRSIVQCNRVVLSGRILSAERIVPLLILIVMVLVVLLGPGLWIKAVMRRYAQPENRYEMTGAEVARRLLDANELHDVKVEVTGAGDHYDPMEKAVRLGEDHYKKGSLAAVTIAAHEVGHAIQDAQAYPALKWRTRLVRILGPVEKLGAGVLMATPLIIALTRHPVAGLLTFTGGFLALGSGVVIHLLTLPSEFDASFNRALPMLEKHGLLFKSDARHARKLLRAAAMTYVAASLMSLLNVARWWAILRR